MLLRNRSASLTREVCTLFKEILGNANYPHIPSTHFATESSRVLKKCVDRGE